MKYRSINALLLLVSLLAGIMVKAQDKKAPDVRTMLEAKNFVFKAQTALPMGGRNVNLTSDYDLTVRPDSVTSYLPYYGRAYTAPVNPGEGGIKFTSTSFDYQSAKEKKNRWVITIKPHDTPDVQDITLDVFDNGTASLHVNNQNRQAISFQGYVTEGKPLSKKAF